MVEISSEIDSEYLIDALVDEVSINDIIVYLLETVTSKEEIINILNNYEE